MENKVRIFNPIKIDACYDVVVVGGGLAGVMAAIGALWVNGFIQVIRRTE